MHDIREVLRDWWGFTAHIFMGSIPGAWDASFKTDGGRRHIRAFGTTARVWEEDGERVTWQEVRPRADADDAIASFVQVSS